jgi:hypothetical protein
LIRQLSIPILCLIFSIGANASDDAPTVLPPPTGAKDIRHVSFNDGHAVQMDFKLYPRFPDNPALDHFQRSLDDSWRSCEWGGKWDHFLQGQGDSEVTMHQWMHAWINESRRRVIVLVSRYRSVGPCIGGMPNNDEQLVSIVEYIDVEPSESAAIQQASCAARDGSTTSAARK